MLGSQYVIGSDQDTIDTINVTIRITMLEGFQNRTAESMKNLIDDRVEAARKMLYDKCVPDGRCPACGKAF